MNVIQAIVLAIVEGLTEFLPVSSTGHMALVSALMGIEQESFTKLFIETIQFGTILSVLVLYWKKFIDFKGFQFYIKLIIAFLPAAVFGVIFKKHIDALIGTPLFIACTLFFGGIILLFVDNWFKNPTIDDEKQATNKNALIIGLFQVLAVVLPGLSRSAATIIGGMQQKMTRKAAAEFSFFLAVPTLAGAFVKSLWDAFQETPEILTQHNISLLVLGNVVGFIVAVIAIKAFISFLTRHGFRLFGYYRILVGITIILLILFGVNLSVI
ncbi:MAG TPA: undecaprenyl-diphosphate phosphatase [Paludibacteraceae bacterium]|nr:undecaprenyl-diphosphate phosphatase [Paludibacteraceae bacterium]